MPLLKPIPGREFLPERREDWHLVDSVIDLLYFVWEGQVQLCGGDTHKELGLLG